MATQEIEQQAVTGRPTRLKPASGGAMGAVRGGGLTPYLFLAPYLVLFGLFVIIPAVLGLWMSLHAWDPSINPGISGHAWVGIDNYKDIFTSGTTVSGPFWTGMKATAIFTVFSVPLLVILPLGVALLLNERFRGRSFFRAVYFAPYVLGVAVIAVLWRYILSGNIGLLNYYLGKVGIDGPSWTNDTPWAWVALVGVTVWWTLGFNTVIYLAGLQDISKETYEAARVDGANVTRRFWHVTLPGLRPVLIFVIVITILASANMFGQSYLITQGQPGNETRTAIYYIADTAFGQSNAGAATAMSFVLAVFLMIVSILTFVLSRRFND